MIVAVRVTGLYKIETVLRSRCSSPSRTGWLARRRRREVRDAPAICLKNRIVVSFIFLGIRVEIRATPPVRNARSRIGRPDLARRSRRGSVAAVAPGGRFVAGSHV